MFIVNLCGTDLELPLSDEEMVAIKKEKKIDLFLRREDTICIKADYRGVDLKEKLPASLWIQEINMLAYVLECMDSEQGIQSRDRSSFRVLRKSLECIPERC